MSFNLEFGSNSPERNDAAWAYHRAADGKDEWLTYPKILQALGPFDLDPCAPIKRPWDTAKHHFTILDNGLLKPWHGRVWCNPPYDRYQIARWLARCHEHRNAIALIFARTETDPWFKYVWTASALIFLRGRLDFYNVDGTLPDWNGGAGSVLVAFNQQNADTLKTCGLDGRFIPL